MNIPPACGYDAGHGSRGASPQARSSPFLGGQRRAPAGYAEEAEMSAMPQKIVNSKGGAADRTRAPGSAAPGRPKGTANAASRKQTDFGSPNADTKAREVAAVDKYSTFNTKYQIRKKLERIESAYATAPVPPGDPARVESQDGLLDIIATQDEGTHRAVEAGANGPTDAAGR